MSKAVSRLDRARAEEQEAQRRVSDVHDGTAGDLTDSEVKRRTRAWNGAMVEVWPHALCAACEHVLFRCRVCVCVLVLVCACV
jgi:hypothetical protein